MEGTLLIPNVLQSRTALHPAAGRGKLAAAGARESALIEKQQRRETNVNVKLAAKTVATLHWENAT